MSIGADPVSELELAIAHGEQERAELTAERELTPQNVGRSRRRTTGTTLISLDNRTILLDTPYSCGADKRYIQYINYIKRKGFRY